jgi:hypothetical protein
VYKISNAQDTFSDPGIVALQKGMRDLNINLLNMTQIVKDKDKSGLLTFVSDYLNNVQKTYGKLTDAASGIADKNTIASFGYMRDQFLKVMAGTNLADFIREKYGKASWFPTVETFGESLRKIFEPVYAAASSVQNDAISMSSAGAALGPQLTNAGNQAFALAKNYVDPVNMGKLASPSERVRLVILKKEIEKLAKKI